MLKFFCYLLSCWDLMLRWKKVWPNDLSLFCSIYASYLAFEIYESKIILAKKIPKGEIVRFVDMCWLHFVKTIVLARCQTRCFNMLVRHHSVSCSAYLEIYFKREDFLKRLVSREELTKKRVSRSRDRRFILSVLLKNVIATFKETFYLLQNICVGILWFSWCLVEFVHQARSTNMLYKGRLKT